MELPAPPIGTNELSPDMQRWLKTLEAYVRDLEARIAALE